ARRRLPSLTEFPRRDGREGIEQSWSLARRLATLRDWRLRRRKLGRCFRLRVTLPPVAKYPTRHKSRDFLREWRRTESLSEFPARLGGFVSREFLGSPFHLELLPLSLARCLCAKFARAYRRRVRLRVARAVAPNGAFSPRDVPRGDRLRFLHPGPYRDTYRECCKRKAGG